MAQSTSREKRHARTKQEILNIAFDLIITKGADKLSLREIARQAGYKSPAGLYEYFDGKDDIIEAVCFEADNRLLSYIRDVDQSLPAHDQLIDIGMAYIRFARENPQQFMFLFDHQTVVASEQDVYEFVTSDTENAFSRAYHAVQQCIDEGSIVLSDGMNTLDVAYSFWALIHGCATLQLRHLKSFPTNFEVVDRQAISRLLDGFARSDVQ